MQKSRDIFKLCGGKKKKLVGVKGCNSGGPDGV